MSHPSSENDPHLEAERLALLALGEPGFSSVESDHLAYCAQCVDELSGLRHAALAGRASMEVGELEAPPHSVWNRIADELSLSSSVVQPGSQPASPPASQPVPQPTSGDDAASSSRTEVPAAAPAPPTPAARRRRWWAWALAAAFVIVAGGGVGTWAVLQQFSATEVAQASLAPFPAHVGAEGSAVVEESRDGSLAVHVRLSADDAPDTYREVWLITADANALVSLGVLDGDEATFPVPRGVDLRDYVLVDVSQEPVDGDPAHSGDSIVRGELSASDRT